MLKKYSKEIPLVLDDKTKNDDSKLIMVLDMGHAFVKTSLFAVYNGTRLYLLKAEVKETDKIIYNGEINFNLLSRFAKRKATEYCDFGKISEMVVIPPRLYTNPLALHRLEFVEDYKQYKKQVVKNYRELYTEASNIDWGVLINNPNEDYRNILVDSLTDTTSIALGNAFVNVPADSITITSPTMAYLGLGEEEPYMVIEIGHITSTIAIIDKGVTNIFTASFGGQFITESLTENDATIDDMKYKHSLSIEELPTDVEQMFENLTKNINEVINNYRTVSDKPLMRYCVLGGSASLAVEEHINDLNTGMVRFYPKLKIDNSKDLPLEVTNYFLSSFGVTNYLLHNSEDRERKIDFNASKGNAMQYYVKKCADWFRKNKILTLSIVASVYIIGGILVYTSQKVNTYYEDINFQYMSEQNNNSNVLSTLTNSKQELNSLMSSEVSKMDYNTGDLLDKLKLITPPNVNIRQMNINSNHDTGVLVVASTNQVVTATLITLLQEGNDAPFRKADILEIKKETEALEEIYITTIYLEGRNL